MLSPEQGAALRALQIVVAAIERHHVQARDLGRTVALCVGALGESKTNPDCKPLLEAYDALARPLGHYLHEQEELVLDRVQLLFAERKLVFGSMAGSLPSVERLAKEKRALLWHHSHLADELARSARASERSPQFAEARAAIRSFAQAFVQHVDFEDQLLNTALEPFLTPKRPPLEGGQGYLLGRAE